MRTRRRALGVLLLCAVIGAGFARADTSTSLVALRQRFFGAENVDPATGAVRADRVILSWFGVTNFAAAIGGHVVLLDAWVPRGEYSGYVPTSINDLAALQPEAIILGHGHFDHGADAAAIAVASGATIIGTPEHCAQARAEVAPAELGCVNAIPDPDAVNELTALDGVGVSVVKHVHSAGEPHDESDLHAPAAPKPDADAVIYHLPSPDDTVHLLRHLGDDEAGTLLYQFRVGNFSFVWHDSSGPLKERAPHLFDVFRTLPATDVQLGAIMGFNQITNGLRDPRMYVEALRPKIFVPTHHDNWAPGITTRAENYKPIVEEELAKIPPEHRPVLRFIGDPQDYVRPEALTFEVGNPYWD